MSKLIKAWYEFMHHQFAVITRSMPSNKIRKYEHIEIQQDFMELEKNRKKQRYKLLEQRKQILQKQLETSQKLLPDNKTTTQIEKMQAQMAILQKQFMQYQKELNLVQEKLQKTESQYILITGHRKLVIMNQIAYYKHMSMHPFGFVLHPETAKAIQNIHYLVEHNLPVPKYKIFELMPEFFQYQIGELPRSAEILLLQKRPTMEPKSQIISYYQGRRYATQSDDQLLRLQKERQDVQRAVDRKITNLLEPYVDFIERVWRGQTRFRSWKHFVYECVDLDESVFTPEENLVRNAILRVRSLNEDLHKYIDAFQQRGHQIKYQLKMPIFVYQHEKLRKFWLKRHQEMIDNMIPLEASIFIPNPETPPSTLEQKIRQALEKQEKNMLQSGDFKDRKNKNDGKIRLLNIITRVLNQHPQEDQIQGEQQQRFEKLNSNQENIFALPKQNRLTPDHFTKMLELNNKEPTKYNSGFFSKYFGVDEKLLKNTLSYISYPKVNEDGSRKILKFIM